MSNYDVTMRNFIFISIHTNRTPIGRIGRPPSAAPAPPAAPALSVSFPCCALVVRWCSGFRFQLWAFVLQLGVQFAQQKLPETVDNCCAADRRSLARPSKQIQYIVDQRLGLGQC